VRPIEIVAFIAMFFATGLSITAGYHRHFAHVSYKPIPPSGSFYLVFGAARCRTPFLNWASDHRLHHRFTDTDNDPYNAGKGFWWSHVGWILFQSRAEKQLTNVGDLMRDRWVRWQHRNATAIALVVGFALPALLGGLTTGRIFGMLLWAGMIRVVFVHHSTFFINSLAHMWGKQPYSRKDTSQDSWWLALLTNGEGYHNFHHMFPLITGMEFGGFIGTRRNGLIRSLKSRRHDAEASPCPASAHPESAHGSRGPGSGKAPSGNAP